MASTNFLIFDEGKQNMMSDGDYNANTQRARGVTPGIAYPNLHNKLYYQVSVMAKAIADFIVSQGANANDEDVEQLTADISTAFTNFVDNQTKDLYLPLSGGTMEGLVSLFTGSTVPTPKEQDNSKKISNTEWVQDYVTSVLEKIDAENVGDIVYRPFLKKGYVKLNGATVQKEDYPRLVQYAITNSLFTADNSATPWLFGQGDGETTFVLPDYRNVFIEGGDAPSKIEAGVPDITGKLEVTKKQTEYQFLIDGGTESISFNGAFTNEDGTYTAHSWSGAAQNPYPCPSDVTFKASRANSIYGNAETVQPPAITLIPQIKY